MKAIKHVHLLGVCGTAMASLAYLLKQAGYKVSGSDEGMYPPMSDFLQEQKIQTFKGFKAANLKSKPDLVVVGNAISRGNVELEAVLNQRLAYQSMPGVINQFFLQQKLPIVVAGTHGKTTTTTLMTHLLEVAGKKPSYLIGGRPANFNTSASYNKSGEHFVIEGDEYDSAYFDKRSKFLHYFPQYLILNNLEFDHADIFDSLDDIKLSFSRLLKLVPGNGLVVYNGDDKNLRGLMKNFSGKALSFGRGKSCDYRFMQGKNGDFEILKGSKTVLQASLSLPGEHNVRNALACCVLALHLNIPRKTITRAFETFKGVQRRLNLLVDNQVLLYDDFAHHPTAIGLTLETLKKKHRGARLIAAFEPRSNTSVRNVFQEQWPQAFAKADVVHFAPIYRLKKISPAERIDLSKICRQLETRGKEATAHKSFEQMLSRISNSARPGDVIVMMSNGAFGGIVHHLKQFLQKKFT